MYGMKMKGMKMTNHNKPFEVEQFTLLHVFPDFLQEVYAHHALGTNLSEETWTIFRSGGSLVEDLRHVTCPVHRRIPATFLVKQSWTIANFTINRWSEMV